ncbi:hypothetical protein V6N13_041081 [Hibiscus sabdariffa]
MISGLSWYVSLLGLDARVWVVCESDPGFLTYLGSCSQQGRDHLPSFSFEIPQKKSPSSPIRSLAVVRLDASRLCSDHRSGKRLVWGTDGGSDSGCTVGDGMELWSLIGGNSMTKMVSRWCPWRMSEQLALLTAKSMEKGTSPGSNIGAMRLMVCTMGQPIDIGFRLGLG